MKSFLFCAVMPLILQLAYATPSPEVTPVPQSSSTPAPQTSSTPAPQTSSTPALETSSTDITPTSTASASQPSSTADNPGVSCTVDQVTPTGEHISHIGTCGTDTDTGTMALKSITCTGKDSCIVPRTDCKHPSGGSGGKCVDTDESCSINTYTFGKDDDICPGKLRCCEGTISNFENAIRAEARYQAKLSVKHPHAYNNNHHNNNNNKGWHYQNGKYHYDEHQQNCPGQSAAHSKIVHASPHAKEIAATSVKKIIHKTAASNYHPKTKEEVTDILDQILHILQGNGS